MTLATEIGAGLPGADSYIDVAGADAYHAGQANATWAALDSATKEAP